MRKISFLQISLFVSLFSLALGGSILTTILIFTYIPLGDFRGVVMILAVFFFLYFYALLFYRGLLLVMPIIPGEILANSRQEFSYHVYLLFYLILFYPVMRSGFIPVPMMKLFYLALGATLGNNTYSSGIIQDPIFVTVGDNSLIGMDALITPHIIENNKLEHHPIRIGNNVTIGAHSVVLAGVTIGDNAIVATGAVVRKGTQIGHGEIWGGVPAKLIKKTSTPET